MLRARDRIFLPPVLALVSFEVLYVARTWDDNRLTGWHWVFGLVDPVRVFAALTAGCALIGVLAWSFRGRQSFRGTADRTPNTGRSLPLVFFMVYFLCGMLLWSVPEVNVDAARYFTQAKHLELFGVRYFFHEWGRGVHAWTDMPLVPLLYGMLFRLFGESRLYVQIFTTSLFALTGVLTFRTGQALWDRETGIYGAAFLLCIPYLYTQIPLMLVDVPVMFFLLLSVFSLIRALRSGGVWIAAASLSIFCTVLSKYSSLLMLSVLPVIVFVLALRDGERSKKTMMMRAGLVFSASLVLTGLFIFWGYDVIREQVRLLLSFQQPALKRWEESFTSTFLFQTHPFLTAFALVSVYAAVVDRDWKYLIILWLVLLIVILQIRRIRYVVMVFPFLALMASYGLRRLRRIDLRIVVVSCAVISSLILAATAYRPFLQSLSMANLQRAGAFLDKSGSSRIEVHVIEPAEPAGSLSVAVPVMDLFTNKTLIVDERSAAVQLPAEAALSPLRFTWEFRTPLYYRSSDDDADVGTVAVISDSVETPLPQYLDRRLRGFRLAGSFDAYEGIFSFQTSVRIYERRSNAWALMTGFGL